MNVNSTDIFTSFKIAKTNLDIAINNFNNTSTKHPKAIDAAIYAILSAEATLNHLILLEKEAQHNVQLQKINQAKTTRSNLDDEY